MADYDDRNDILLLTVLLLAREWTDEPDRWQYLSRRLIEPLLRRRRDQGFDPETEWILRDLLMQAPRFGRAREQMREIAIDVAQAYRRDLTAELNSQLSYVGGRIARIEEAQAQYGSELHSYLWATTSGVDLRNAKIVRYVPMRIYMGDPVPSEASIKEIEEAFREFAYAMGLERAEELPARRGSWFRSFFQKTKQALTDEDLKPTFDKAKVAFEMKYLDKPQAEVTGILADAAAKLVAAFSTISGPCCSQVGSLLIVKLPGVDGKSSMVVKTLTPMELRSLEENASMLEQPMHILGWLGKVCDPRLQRDGQSGRVEMHDKTPKHIGEGDVLDSSDSEKDEAPTKLLSGTSVIG